jgi:hypothetical protein
VNSTFNNAFVAEGAIHNSLCTFEAKEHMQTKDVVRMM